MDKTSDSLGLQDSTRERALGVKVKHLPTYPGYRRNIKERLKHPV